MVPAQPTVTPRGRGQATIAWIQPQGRAGFGSPNHHIIAVQTSGFAAGEQISCRYWATSPTPSFQSCGVQTPGSQSAVYFQFPYDVAHRRFWVEVSATRGSDTCEWSAVDNAPASAPPSGRIEDCN